MLWSRYGVGPLTMVMEVSATGGKPSSQHGAFPVDNYAIAFPN